MLGRSIDIRTQFVDADSIQNMQRQINTYLEVNKYWEVLDIKYNMLTDPACENQLYMTALIIYKEQTT